MVWQRDNAQGGFTTAARSWLPVTAPHLARAVEAQAGDGTSLLNHYRRALAFRRAHGALVRGAMSPVTASGDLASFTRTEGEETLFCAFNLGEGTVEAQLPPGQWTTIGQDIGSQTAQDGGRVTLGPWGLHLARRD
jgi:alpha-glucosidase